MYRIQLRSTLLIVLCLLASSTTEKHSVAETNAIPDFAHPNITDNPKNSSIVTEYAAVHTRRETSAREETAMENATTQKIGIKIEHAPTTSSTTQRTDKKDHTLTVPQNALAPPSKPVGFQDDLELSNTSQTRKPTNASLPIKPGGMAAAATSDVWWIDDKAMIDERSQATVPMGADYTTMTVEWMTAVGALVSLAVISFATYMRFKMYRNGGEWCSQYIVLRRLKKRKLSSDVSRLPDCLVEGFEGDDVQTEMVPLTSAYTRFPVLSGCHTTPLITHSMIEQIFAVIPERLSLRDLRLVYSLAQHGASLATFYRLQEKGAPCLLIIRDQTGAVFGAFLGDSWHKSTRYYGSKESFVMQLRPTFEIFSWSCRNNYFQLGHDDFIAVGGGDHFALWLDSNFKRGSSMKCATFDSPPLASASDFICHGLELWGFC